MHRRFCGLILGLILATSSMCAWAQDEALLERFKNLKDQAETTSSETPRLELSPRPAEVAMYEAEHRYRMIWQLIGFVLGLGALHLIQVKLKIHRGYFWGLVVAVSLGAVLSYYRPKIAPQRIPSKPDSEPTYAPTHVR